MAIVNESNWNKSHIQSILYCHQKPIIIAENGLGNQDMLE